MNAQTIQLLRDRLDDALSMHREALGWVDQLLGRCCELEAEARQLRKANEKLALPLATPEQALAVEAALIRIVGLDEAEGELEQLQSMNRALMAANRELREVVDVLMQQPRALIVAKGAIPWTH